MSQKDVEIVRTLNDLYNERNYGELANLMAPDFVWDMSRVDNPERGTYAGLPELRRFVDTWSEGFAFDHVEVEEMIDAGEVVVVVIRHAGRGRASGINVEQRYAMVWTLSGGRAVRMEMHPSREEALKAVGLEE